MKILIALVLICSSCNYCRFCRGVQNDFKMAENRNREYLIHVAFSGILKEKLLSTQNNNHELVIRLSKIDSLPSLVNREYKPYFRFEGDSVLSIAVNQNIYDRALVRDTIVKEKETKFIILNGIKEKNILLWLAE